MEQQETDNYIVLKFRHSASKKLPLRQKQSSEERRKNIQKTSRNHLTEGKVCAAPNEEFLFLIGCSMSYAQTVRLCRSSWITHWLTAVPMRARATFVELQCGCLISPEGWVTRAISVMTRGRHWTTYYKLLERGSVRTLRLARALFEGVNNALPRETLNRVIDDTLIPRQSEQAPSRKYVLPIVSRSVPATGNRNKLTIALALVRSLAPVMMNQPARLLFDAWFMRARLVLPLLS